MKNPFGRFAPQLGDDPTQEQVLEHLAQYVPLEFVLEVELYARSRQQVELSNGPGGCVSVWPEWMRAYLRERPTRGYNPCYVSPAMLFGIEGIREHLREVHHLSGRMAESLRIDNCYRLHDMLHIREEKPG